MTATEKAYTYIKSAILKRSFREGEFLTEGAIAQTLGVSRTPVREALLKLEAEDFVVLLPKKGIFIREPSLREIREVMEARLMIELFAAEHAVETPSNITPTLRTLFIEQAKAADTGDVEEFIRLDRQFHYTIVSSCGTIVLKFYDSLRDRQILMGIRAMAYSPRRMKRVLEEHAAIVAALEQDDGDDLKRCIRTHLDATRVRLEEHTHE